MENRKILTQYQPLRGNDYEQQQSEECGARKTLMSNEDSVWKHTNDLDVFFTNAYLYHKDGGFYAKIVSKIFDVVLVVYLTTLTLLMLVGVNYPVLFKDVPPEGMDEIPAKLQVGEILRSWSEIRERLYMGHYIFLSSCIIFTLFKIGQLLAYIPLCCQIKQFYEQGLQIQESEMDNYTWDEVKVKILNFQKEEKFCITNDNFDELDIHHRILRFTNYFVAMVSHNIIDLNLEIPILGKVTYLSRGLKYNLELALFWGPWSPFVNNWRLHDDFKRKDKLHQNAKKIKDTFKLLALLNFVLMIFILFWQCLYFINSLAGFFKAECLKMYKWSLFGEVYLRHYNELDHELKLRLSKAFNPSMTYVKTFPTKRFIMIISQISLFLGAPFIILVILTAWSAEVLQVQHLITVFTFLGISVKFLYDSIPSESDVHDPEKHLKCVLHYAKYAPEHWIGKAHTPKVKKEFSKLFEHKVVHILEDILSPIVTPLILYFKMANNTEVIAEFLRKYTVEVNGVGDVCSFAHLRKVPTGETVQHVSQIGSVWDDSSTMRSMNRMENSLQSFTVNNRNWAPTGNSNHFISKLNERRAEKTSIENERNRLRSNDIQNTTFSDLTFSGTENTFFQPLRNYPDYEGEQSDLNNIYNFTESDVNIRIEQRSNEEAIFMPEVTGLSMQGIDSDKDRSFTSDRQDV